MPDPSSIPPRPWIYGTHLLRGFVSMLIAPGGTGKSQLAMAIAVAVASGKSILGHHIHKRCRVWLLNLEDPLDEMDRRLAALMMRHNIHRGELDGWLAMHSGRDRRVCMAARSADQTIVSPDKEEIITCSKNNDFGLLVVDPWVKSHILEENSNQDMDAAATAWAEVCDEANAAGLIVHHVRKGPATDIDAARGGKALSDAARAAYLLSSMSPEEAEKFGIDADGRWKYVRLDDAKANMAPRAERADWFKMDMMELGNCTPDYPNGDKVAALVPWQPPSALGDLSTLQCNEALDKIAAGPQQGVRYTFSRSGTDNSRWAGQVLIDLFAIEEKRAASIIDTWKRNGLLVEQTYHDEKQRKNRLGIVVVDVKRPGVEVT
jgi:hypothetical protein